MEAVNHDSNRLALTAMILGIIACAFNLLLILAFIGVILGIVAIMMGAITYRKHRYGKVGLTVGLLSFVPILAYVFTFVALKLVDPFY